MKLSDSNQQKDKFFLHIFGFSSFLHIILIVIFQYYSILLAPVFGILVYFSLYLYRRRITGNALYAVLLYAMNIYLFILNIESLSPLTLIYFVLPLITAALANAFRPMIILTMATFVEITVLILFFDQLARTPSSHYNHISIFAFIFIVFLLTFLYTFYFSHLWQQLQDRNRTMEKALISREGYLQLFFEPITELACHRKLCKEFSNHFIRPKKMEPGSDSLSPKKSYKTTVGL